MNTRVFLLFSSLLICGICADTLCGGVGSSEIDATIVKLVKDTRTEVESLANESFSVYTPVEATKQVVAGMLYKVKVFVGNDHYIFVTIYDRFGDVSVKNIETGKTTTDHLYSNSNV